MIAHGFIKTGLGRRTALQMICLLGKRTLGLAYGLAFADLLLAPAMPSNTARCGGVIYPVVDSLAHSFDFRPGDRSRGKIGTFLITCIGNVNDITAVLFMTGYTGNPAGGKTGSERRNRADMGKLAAGGAGTLSGFTADGAVAGLLADAPGDQVYARCARDGSQ